MEILDNVSSLFGDDLRLELGNKQSAKIAAASFSIHAFASLDRQLHNLERFEFIFTGPSFVTDHGASKSQHREFIIPPVMNRRDLAGTPSCASIEALSSSVVKPGCTVIWKVRRGLRLLMLMCIGVGILQARTARSGAARTLTFWLRTIFN